MCALFGTSIEIDVIQISLNALQHESTLIGQEGRNV